MHPDRDQVKGSGRAVKYVGTGKFFYIERKTIGEQNKQNSGENCSGNSLLKSRNLQTTNPIKKGEQNKIENRERNKPDDFR